MSAPTSRNGLDPAADAASLLSRLGLVTLSIIAPLVAMAARRALFTLIPVGSALILIAAALGGRRDMWRPLRAWLVSPIGLTALFLAFWSLLSLIWTPFPLDAAARFGKIAGAIGLAVAAAAFLPGSTRAANLYLLPFGAGFAALGGLFVAFEGPALLAVTIEGDDSTLERGIIGLVVVVWPALGALAVRDRWPLAAGVAIVAAAATIIAHSPLALMGLAAGALTFALSAGAPRLISRVLAAVATIVIIGAPLLPLAAALLPKTGTFGADGPLGETLASLEVWRTIVLRDGWRLVTGHGLDTVARGVARGLLPVETPGGLLFEVWFELGALGAVGYAWLAAQCFLAAGQVDGKLAPFALAGLVAPLTMAAINLPSAQLWWVNVLAMAGIAFTHVMRGRFLARRLPTRRLSLRRGGAGA